MKAENRKQTKIVEETVRVIVLSEQEARDIKELIGKTSQDSRRGMGISGEVTVRLSELFFDLSMALR